MAKVLFLLAVSFNSRAREGRDRYDYMRVEWHTGFNSRAREGRDRSSEVASTPCPGFNSRAREGRDA